MFRSFIHVNPLNLVVGTKYKPLSNTLISSAESFLWNKFIMSVSSPSDHRGFTHSPLKRGRGSTWIWGRVGVSGRIVSHGLSWTFHSMGRLPPFLFFPLLYSLRGIPLCSTSRPSSTSTSSLASFVIWFAYCTPYPRIPSQMRKHPSPFQMRNYSLLFKILQIFNILLMFSFFKQTLNFFFTILQILFLSSEFWVVLKLKSLINNIS